MNVTNKKITIDLSIRELELLDLSLSDSLADYWKKYKNLDDGGKFEEFKQKLIEEINALGVDGMPKLEKLNALVGGYVNLEYRLPNGKTVKFLDDNATYLGYQLESEFDGDRCFGLAASMDFLLVCTYETNGEKPELVAYKKR